jgi:hypothetical protein
MAPQLGFRTLIDKLRSHAMSLGVFENVGSHEPKSVPGTGITGALWPQTIQPSIHSGLNSTAALVVLTLRAYTNFIAEPQDEIDPNLIDAIDSLYATYTGNFTLDGIVMAIDLMGIEGTPLKVDAGYVQINQTMYRIMDMTIPVIYPGIWAQSP